MNLTFTTGSQIPGSAQNLWITPSGDLTRPLTPKGTFGSDDNDVFIAKELIDDATYKGEPVWANKIKTALYFYENIEGVPSRVPVRINDDGMMMGYGKPVPLTQ